MLVAGLISFSIIGILVVVVAASTGPILAGGSVAITVVLVFVLVGITLLFFLAVGTFQTNAIQFGSAALRNIKSPELGAFVHWYYWVLYLPTFLTGAPPLFYLLFADEFALTVTFLVLCPAILYAFLMLFMVTLIIHCARCTTGQIVTEQRITKNLVTLACRVTQYTLQRPASPGHRGFFARLSNTRQSKGGPADDEEVDSVVKFWLVVLLMASLFGFMFWDDMWAVSLVNALFDGPVDLAYNSSDHYFTSSQVDTPSHFFGEFGLGLSWS